MTVLIAGCGDLGTEAGLRFAAAGHPVTGWRRNPGVLSAPIVGVAADLSQASLPRIPATTEIVVIAVAADASSADAYRRAYLDGVRHVTDALVRDDVRPQRALFVSSTAVYGAHTGDTDETTPPQPSAFNGEVLLEAEELFFDRVPGGTVLRLGGIYGPGRTRLIDQVRSGEARATTRRTARIHRDDAAEAIRHLMTMSSAPESLYLGVDDEPAAQGDVVRFLAEELGVPAPAPGEASSQRGADRAISNARLRRTGWVPTYPTYVEGYRAVLAGAGTRHP
ncbi:MAG: NAD-dependent epimerase/dehydratase family protein [Marmoricola sp.]